jgi:hypothetical protein
MDCKKVLIPLCYPSSGEIYPSSSLLTGIFFNRKTIYKRFVNGWFWISPYSTTLQADEFLSTGIKCSSSNSLVWTQVLKLLDFKEKWSCTALPFWNRNWSMNHFKSIFKILSNRQEVEIFITRYHTLYLPSEPISFPTPIYLDHIILVYFNNLTW